MMYRMRARLSGRTKRRNRSGSGMEENAAHLRVDSILGPVRMLGTKSRSFNFAGRPVELLCQKQTFLARHGAQRSYLFRTWCFVGEHDQSLVETSPFSKASQEHVHATPNRSFR